MTQVPADYYEKGLKNNFWQKIWHEGKWRAVRRLLAGQYSQILDIGCASGWLTCRIAQVFPKAQIMGIDTAKEIIKLASVIHPEVKFIQADAHQLPFKNDSFDLITATEVLEHVVDPLKVLYEIRRCLASKSKVIISMDSGSQFFNLIWFFWLRNKGRVWRHSHLHQFNIDKLQKLFLKAGFVIEKKRLFNFGLAVVFLLKYKGKTK